MRLRTRPRFPGVRVVAVVPTYNEADSLAALIRGLRDVEPGIGIVVVDDASSDGTSRLAHDLAGELGDIDVIDRPAKYGLGSAYRQGFAHAIDAGADVCVQIDADLSHDPAVLPALLANVAHGADLAIGSRYVPGARTERWPWRRRWLSRWGNRYAAGLLGLAINDATAGYRAYRTDALRRIRFDTVTAEGYGYQIEMTHRLVRAGGKVVEFPIDFRERGAGESKLNRGIVREAFGLVLRLWLDDRRDRRRRRRESG
jgi:dolichol-phosphate mannosyltransferase